MRSITFVSTSRSDEQALGPILEKQCKQKGKVYLIKYEGIEPAGMKNCSKVIEIAYSAEVDNKNQGSEAMMIENSIKKIIKMDQRTVLFVIGDRSETLLFTYYALIYNIPVIHHSGGDITNGAIDNQIRDAITALADFHVTSHEKHTRRIKKLGERPERIWTVGEPSLNILRKELNKTNKVLKYKGREYRHFALWCFHSSTLDNIDFKLQSKKIIEMIKSIDKNKDINMDIVMTYPNQDKGGEVIHNQIIEACINKEINITYIRKLGKKYYEALKSCAYLVGNSSSGILEASMAEKITINVGDRQNGRLVGKSVCNIGYSAKELVMTIRELKELKKNLTKKDYESKYYDKNCIDKITNIISRVCTQEVIIKRKEKKFV